MVRAVVTALIAAGMAGTAEAGGAVREVAVSQDYPLVTVRISEREFFQRYERVSVFVESSEDAYLTVFRIDTDGRMRVLYPWDPRGDNFVRAGQVHQVPNPYGQRGGHAFVIDDYPGVGYVFVVASARPFDYRPYTRNDHWEWRNVASNGRITGDPYVGFVEVVEQMIPPDAGPWTFDVVPYFVERPYPYPRFLCYECHTYVPHPAWDPYGSWCPRFQIVVFEDAVRYATVVYPATNVVYPATLVEPHYVIRGRTQTDPFITRVRRDTRSSGQGVSDRGVRGADLGGIGSVPAPVRGPTRRAGGDAPSAPRTEGSKGGLGGVLRRLFGGDDDAQRPVVTRDGQQQGEQVRPKLERRTPTGATTGGATRRKPEQPSQIRRPTSSPSQPAARPTGSPAARRPATPRATARNR